MKLIAENVYFQRRKIQTKPNLYPKELEKEQSSYLSKKETIAKIAAEISKIEKRKLQKKK